MRMQSAVFSLRCLMLMMTVTALLAGCGGGSNEGAPPSGASPDIVIIANASQQGSNAYNPNSLTVSLGSTVIWKNSDGTTHTVKSDPPSAELDSGTIAAGGTFSHIFMTVGTFNYHCATTGHNMTGSVEVVP